MKKYVKPKFEMVDLRAEERIAQSVTSGCNPCADKQQEEDTHYTYPWKSLCD